MTRHRIFVALAASLVFAACSSTYKLKPLGDTTTVLDGVDVQELITPDCVIAAGFLRGDRDDFQVITRITNKLEDPIDIHPGSFALSSEKGILTDSPVVAHDPDAFLKRMTEEAELLETRANTKNWEGVDILTQTMGEGAYKDAEVERLKKEHAKNERERADNVKKAARLREKHAQADGKLLRRQTLKTGESVTGIVAFPIKVLDEGPVSFEVRHPNCTGALKFKISN